MAVGYHHFRKPLYNFNMTVCHELTEGILILETNHLWDQQSDVNQSITQRYVGSLQVGTCTVNLQPTHSNIAVMMAPSTIYKHV